MEESASVESEALLTQSPARIRGVDLINILRPVVCVAGVMWLTELGTARPTSIGVVSAQAAMSLSFINLRRRGLVGPVKSRWCHSDWVTGGITPLTPAESPAVWVYTKSPAVTAGLRKGTPSLLYSGYVNSPFCRLRRSSAAPPIPARPVPRRTIVTGSGTTAKSLSQPAPSWPPVRAAQ